MNRRIAHIENASGCRWVLDLSKTDDGHLKLRIASKTDAEFHQTITLYNASHESLQKLADQIYNYLERA